MSKLRLELRKLILQEMRKREFGESKNPSWLHSNMRLTDIINDVMKEDTGNPLDKVVDADGNMVPSDFTSSEPAYQLDPDLSAWKGEEPEDTDWNLPETESIEGQPVSPECLSAILFHMNAWMEGGISAYSGAESLGQEFINLQGQIAFVLESIQSNAPDAAEGTMSAYDIGELEALADENMPSYDILMSNPSGVAIVTTINKILNGESCPNPGSAQTQSGAQA